MKKGFLFIVLCIYGLVACAPAAGGQTFRLTAQAARADASVVPSETPLPPPTDTPIPATETPVPPPSPTPTSVSFPNLTFAANGVCRTGPGTRYYRTGQVVPKGKTYQSNGRTKDGSWVSVEAPTMSDYCWVEISSIADPGDLSALRVVDVQPLPDSPINLVSGTPACGNRHHLLLTWYAVYATGYHIYRSGKPIGTVYDDHFVDIDTPKLSKSTEVLYSVEAFNASGVSLPNTISVTIC